MSGIGPGLPPHLIAKRKRQQADDLQDEAGAKGNDESEKRPRVIGPAMPPASLDERPLEPAIEADADSEGDEDDFGPALPTINTNKPALPTLDVGNAELNVAPTGYDGSSERTKRDEWMMMPPEQDGLAARMDPTKQRPRGFNTGKSAKGPDAAADDKSAWNETPEQRQKRLRDEVMGVSKAAPPASMTAARSTTSVREDVESLRKKQDIEKARGPSLMNQHEQAKGNDADDDPSKRAFDREKDMRSGMRVGNAQRKQMLDKAAGFSAKFSGGSYL
ncbi:hypothetical protein BAUCODRAFT_34994 [Baudoinia panamericana UAMH 10762]|uniref:DUF3752 domain-containing protein n=1 Tax=Baudoinia panamericana (strain UAMH 10762) TaxID=717646 RepID=M2MEL4_BAUPA|nr:uncharacterized protein BAUCODRAFT_34994 [Baudoinia panamericana UAMH 10762]EMC94996.1 hypothetical protein BAUCODRAFT_34994 [Baudoinia panamericana UAMH 10762]